MSDSIVFARHDDCNKEFAFIVPNNVQIKKGDYLLVDTRYGKSFATATTDTIQFDLQNSSDVLVKMGVTFPMRRVLDVCKKQFVEQIVRSTFTKAYETLRILEMKLVDDNHDDNNQAEAMPF